MDLPQPSQQQPVVSAVDQLKQQNQQVRDQFQQQQDTSTQYFLQNQQNQNGPVSQALSILGDKSKAGKVGSALNTKDYSNMCLEFVDDATGNTQRQPTAYADYQTNAQAGKVKTSGTPPKGARIYFAPTQDNPAGHVMLSNGDGTGTGATTNAGIKTFKISDWEKYASQQFIGWSK